MAHLEFMYHMLQLVARQIQAEACATILALHPYNNDGGLLSRLAPTAFRYKVQLHNEKVVHKG